MDELHAAQLEEKRREVLSKFLLIIRNMESVMGIHVTMKAYLRITSPGYRSRAKWEVYGNPLNHTWFIVNATWFMQSYLIRAQGYNFTLPYFKTNKIIVYLAHTVYSFFPITLTANSINRLAFIIKAQCVLCGIWTENVYIIWKNLRLHTVNNIITHNYFLGGYV
jgi:hypothetical protein